MKIHNIAVGALLLGGVTTLTGCSIGKSESDCPGMENGVLCKGPREVMELTNTRDDLSDLMTGEDGEGKQGKAVSDSRYPTQISPPKDVGYAPTPVVHAAPAPLVMKNNDPNSAIKPVKNFNMPVMQSTFSGSANAVTIQPAPIAGSFIGKPFSGSSSSYNYQSGSYAAQNSIPRSNDLYSTNSGQPTNPSLSVEQQRQYHSQGYKQPVVAPEPLAVLQQGKVMRILFAPYTDDNNALNLPGYVYVSVKSQTWIAGQSATDNPARIVPLEVQDSARDNLQQQQRATQAISASGVRRGI